MKELALKYGCNPNQKPARIFMTEGELPIEVLNGKPGYRSATPYRVRAPAPAARWSKATSSA